MGRIIALGFFDGVHLGHKALLDKTKEIADWSGSSAAALTFESSPASRITGMEYRTITSAQDRKNLIFRQSGIKETIILDFNKDLMQTPPEVFFDFLCKEYDAEGFVCGYDYRFGKGGAGDAQFLERLCEDNLKAFSCIQPVILKGMRVSSTYIRELLSRGELEEAEYFLGHRHIMTGDIFEQSVMGDTVLRLLPDSGVAMPMEGSYETLIYSQGTSPVSAITAVGENAAVSKATAGELRIQDKRATMEFVRYLGQ